MKHKKPGKLLSMADRFKSTKPLFATPHSEQKFTINIATVKTLEDVITLLDSLEITVTRESKGFERMKKYLMPIV